MAGTTHTPKSLVQPDAKTAAERRLLRSVIAANGAPSGISRTGKGTSGHRFLFVTIKLKDVGTTLKWRLWHLDRVSDEWCLDPRIGGCGEGEQFVDADGVFNPQRGIIEVGGIDKVYIELTEMTGVFANGVDVWLAVGT